MKPRKLPQTPLLYCQEPFYYVFGTMMFSVVVTKLFSVVGIDVVLGFLDHVALCYQN